MSKLKIKEIVNYLESTGYKFIFKGDENNLISGFSTLFNYQEGTITFVSSLNSFNDHAALFKDRKIQLIIIDPDEEIHESFTNVIRIEKPKKVFFSILDHFFTETSNEDMFMIVNNHPADSKRSFISDNALIGKNVRIGSGCVIEEGVYIGDNTNIHHNVVIRSKTKIGKNCTILSGTIIGESGFNPLKENDNSRNLIKHYGGVTIKDNVHIGDNCNISKGSIEDTIIKSGVKINKQVILAHNVRVGEHTVFTAPTFVGGSVQIGEKCHIAATVIRNQCKIGENATLGLGSVVVKDVEAGETVIGNPARPMVR
ncbi:DapH/DapD/GlmU-related protein [Oceanobacillus sp. HCA-5259]|uniref:DapH/DapD/GlmU-related protein n=1 Tax=Oceanobacillus sp. HCA-5259 TaxID=3134661 RepID=UPI0030C0E033